MPEPTSTLEEERSSLPNASVATGQKLLCALQRGQTHSESWRLAHSVVHRASVKLGAWFDRQPRTYAVSIPSFVGPRAGQRTPCQKTLGEVKQNRCSAPASQDRSSSKSRTTRLSP